MLSLSKRYHFKAAAVPLALAIFLVMGSLNSCSEDPPTGGKDSCDTCNVPCDTCEVPCDTCDTTKPPCDTCNIDKDSAAHAFTWTEYSIPGVSSLTGVAVFSDNRIYAFGNDLYIFDGTKWTTTPAYVGSTTRRASFIDSYVFAISESNYWVVGGNLIYHGDGKFVEEYRFTTGGIYRISACWGISSKDMFFVGDTGLVMHYDGTTFTQMPRVTTKNLRSVWGTSHNDVWAAGWNSSTGESVVIHYDGTSWKEDEISTSGKARDWGIGNVWSTDSSGHKIAIISGSTIFRKTDNGAWRSDSGSVPNQLLDNTYIGLGSRGNSINDFMALGGWGFVAHWNGKDWKKYHELYNYGNPLYGASAFSMKGNTACIVGVKSGTSWIAIGRRK